MKRIIMFTFGILMLSGCVTVTQERLNKSQIALMPPEAAQLIISRKIGNFDKNKITVTGSLTQCDPASKTVSIEHINSAGYGNIKGGRTLTLGSDFKAFTLCNRAIRIQSISEFEARELVNALNSLGAQIPNLIVVTD
jgi:hypothetical protein